ncbi:hypothetical protein [Actinoalloteichus hymeniacidonis]|uniref:Uncharacterized protein n=1 Tax=Actinoalloteichus hymeniacidonis TaxID=340345 RepID=A0AAC9HL23_9PSEU|nr:hypothetical protein [Actinoalloteichus hymeniacidonis]AOS61149.1 hypothetical protein TL08_01550 [Actinoalloteichus hymeniacidonis]MBB5910850.1 hypothetical protein [Actinoalloteichus hymeniacidonis]
MTTAPRLVVLPAVGACAVFGANLPGRGPTFLLDLGAVHVEIPIPPDKLSRACMADFLRTLSFAADRASEWLDHAAGPAGGTVITPEPPTGIPQGRGRHCWPEKDQDPPDRGISGSGWWSSS